MRAREGGRHGAAGGDRAVRGDGREASWGGAEDPERWVAASGWVHSTVRCYQGVVAAFCGYVTDPRSG